ncbi:MAG: hypothetical protein QGH59_04775, partial [Gemmatimonadota bacterium]|nr:hypothetical protein [Gemmatimonadota bacterium]
PHIGSMTREGQARVGMELVEGVGKAVRKIMSAKATALADRRQAAAEAAELAAAEEAAAAANGPVPPGLPGPTDS